MNVWYVGREKLRKAEVVMNHYNNASVSLEPKPLLNYADKSDDKYVKVELASLSYQMWLQKISNMAEHVTKV